MMCRVTLYVWCQPDIAYQVASRYVAGEYADAVTGVRFQRSYRTAFCSWSGCTAIRYNLEIDIRHPACIIEDSRMIALNIALILVH